MNGDDLKSENTEEFSIRHFILGLAVMIILFVAAVMIFKNLFLL